MCILMFAGIGNAFASDSTVMADTAAVMAGVSQEADASKVKSVEELEQANKKLQRRSHMNFIASMLLVALIMMFFVWDIKLQNRKHLLELERKNNALQHAHDMAVAARNEAEAASLVKSQFMQQMTHEIRTPLNVISGFTQLLTTPGMTFEQEELDEMHNAILSSTDHLTTMLSDIIIIADAESKTIAKDDIRTMTLEEFSHLLTDVADMKASADETITTEVNQLAKAVQNVINNANKFGKVAYVEMATGRNGEVTITVSDEGPGIDKADEDKIFKRFYKKDSFVPGVGLGLNVSRALVKQLGGKLSLDSSYTRGARFVFQIPKYKIQ